MPADQSIHRLADTVKGDKVRYMTLAMECEHTAYRSLVMRSRAVLADSEPVLPCLARGCITTGFTASVPADQSSHRLSDTVKGSELRYTTLAMEREHTAYRSLLMRSRAVLAGSEPMLARLVRGCFATAFTASVPADQSSHPCSYCQG